MAANQVSVFLDPTLLPSRSMPDQETFDKANDYYFANLPLFGQQLNAVIAAFNAASAGSAYTIPYTIDLTGTSDIDPGAGKLRFDSTTQNTATTLRLDILSNIGTDCTAMIDTFDASTSAVKGTIRIVKQGDATKFLMFNVNARTAPSGYRDITVSPVASSSANPFVNGDAVLLFFQRTGDKGQTGATGANGALNLLGSATISTAVANVDFLSLFSDAYEKYTVEIEGLTISASAPLMVGLAFGGAVNSTSSYMGPLDPGATTSSATTSFQLPSIATGGAAASFTMELRNARSTTTGKGFGVRGFYWNGTAYVSLVKEGMCVISTAASGFRLSGSGANITGGVIRVYGHTNV